jgi:hypothetical protein
MLQPGLAYFGKKVYIYYNQATWRAFQTSVLTHVRLVHAACANGAYAVFPAISPPWTLGSALSGFLHHQLLQDHKSNNNK